MESDPDVDLDKTNAVGFDYSSPYFFVSSDGHITDMPHFYSEVGKRLAKEQRKRSRMVKGSANYRRQKVRILKAHEYVRNCRRDYHRKESHRLADAYDFICLEDINMARGFYLAKATNDNGFGAFRQMLTYKVQEQEKKVITDRQAIPFLQSLSSLWSCQQQSFPF